MITSLGIFTSQNSSQNYFVFEKIDNEVKILLDDEAHYNSGQISGNPEMELKIDLVDLNEIQTITIKLLNGSGQFDQEDKHWEIRYELFLDDQPVDYIWEYADDSRTGIVFEKKYKLSEWR
ncbi:MAG: hypothetical protein ACO2ZZ_13095 [Cyclobacteriaceae bacterium]